MTLYVNIPHSNRQYVRQACWKFHFLTIGGFQILLINYAISAQVDQCRITHFKQHVAAAEIMQRGNVESRKHVADFVAATGRQCRGFIGDVHHRHRL